MPIDVVIPTCIKDLSTLEIVIANARKYVQDVGNIYVISDKPYTQSAIHIPEESFPFTKADVEAVIPLPRHSWYYQQLLKLYVFEAIGVDGLSDNVLILDSETIFYRPVAFIDEMGHALYCTSSEFHQPYYDHMNRLIPGASLGSGGRRRSGIVHHMLFQREVIAELRTLFDWRTFLAAVDPAWYGNSGASEYEIYFRYVTINKPDRVAIRELKWDLTDRVVEEADYDFLTAHILLRK